MTSPTTWLLNRELINVVERLSLDFPETPIGTIKRTVESVAPPARSSDVRHLNVVVSAVETAARQSLMPLAWPAA